MIREMLVQAPQNHKQAKANVSATDHVIFTVYKCPAFFSRPQFGMDFVASYQGDTIVLLQNKTMNWNGNTKEPLMLARVPHIVHIFSLSQPMRTYLVLVTMRLIRYTFFLPTQMSFYLLIITWIQADYASCVWAVMERFGNKQALYELNGIGIHRLENILTLNVELHEVFDSLKIWLERIASVCNSCLRVNLNFNWGSRAHPTPTGSVHFVLILISTRVGRLL